ncbi:MAG: DUF2095 family protein [Candidatus Atabeyarchaeum deiterrae]|jgi:hypothetical protein
MAYDKESFKKRFPHLYEEIEDPKENNVQQPTDESGEVDSLSGFVPEATSYIRRAHTDDEAIEIVSYLMKRTEISNEYAKSLVQQIQEKGVRSFGTLKTWGHYEKTYRRKPLRSNNDEDDNEDEKLD